MAATFVNTKHTILSIVLIVLVQAGVSQELDLMPMPAKYEIGRGNFPISGSFSISVEGSFDDRLSREATRFLRRLDAKTGSFFDQHKVEGAKKDADLKIIVDRPGKVELYENESYDLNISPTGLRLTAITDIGAIRGLETLLQLVEVSDGRYVFPEIAISDQPRFVWRGLMLDVARHFMPMDVVYRNLDAMAALKLNVLHLHLSDDQGFRFESAKFPELTSKGSDGNFYTRQQLKKLVDYAHQRGIRVIPEIDVPGHATAILTAYPELGSKDTSYSIERYAGIFDPTLDPTNEQVYDFLEALFAEIGEIFPDPYFHIGGDENLGKHWDANPDIQTFMRSKGLKTNHELQAYFNTRLQEILKKQGKFLMGWEEIMSPEMNQTALIHSWRGEWEGMVAKKSLYEAAKKGYKTILSNGYYLDLMQTTQDHYLVDPLPSGVDMAPEARENILGGEMCMWSELVVPETIDSRIWPRGAAIAERFWSPEEVNDVDDMYRRLWSVSLELEQLNLKHQTAQDVILRKLAQSREIEPLETLVDVVEPMKGYTRNPEGTMYASYSPFTLWADAALPDARVARNFNEQVKSYLHSSADCKPIQAQLTIWQNNHQKVLPIIERSPVLNEIKELSANLSEVAGVGNAAITFLETEQVPDAEWIRSSKKALENARKQGGRTELQIITGIRLLVDQVEAAAK